MYQTIDSIHNAILKETQKWYKQINKLKIKYKRGSLGTCLWNNKAVLEPGVSPAFAITYFCNHCNIRFENTSKYVDTLTLFSKKLNQRSLTPRWPLTPCLLRSHVWLYPRIIVSKSHGNTSMYVDTVINLANYHIHTHTYYLHTTYILRTYYVQNEWSHSLLLNSVQARQTNGGHWVHVFEIKRGSISIEHFKKGGHRVIDSQ